jgi:hypothetical protein
VNETQGITPDHLRLFVEDMMEAFVRFETTLLPGREGPKTEVLER